MSKLNRRQFARSTAFGSLAFAAAGHRILGANGDVRVACIGVGGRGSSHMKTFQKTQGSRVIALCDADRDHLEARQFQFEKDPKNGKVETYVDARKLLERKDLDAVVIATPNHWHSLMGIYACQAGKDVYVEKPVCHNIWEGKQLVAAQRKYNRIVQAGSQNRSDVGLLEFFADLHAGKYGEIKQLRGLCYRKRSGIGDRLSEPLKPPEEVDYNLWLGPAADLPLYRPRFHYDWHWVWNTGNGDIGNQGPHETNLLCWALKDPGIPKRVTAFGGRFGWHDAGQTPNMHFAAWDFDGVPVYFEVRDLSLGPDGKGRPTYKGTGVGIIVTCEGGEFRGGRGGGRVFDKDNKEIKRYKGDSGRGHAANFIKAVNSRKVEDLHAPVHLNHLSASFSHQANIAFQVGSHVTPEELRDRLKSDDQALEALDRFSEQLGNWKVDLAKDPWTLGLSLEFDPEALQFKGDLADKANTLVRRQDRAPFVVPEIA